jgi:hypothetical protein
VCESADCWNRDFVKEIGRAVRATFHGNFGSASIRFRRLTLQDNRREKWAAIPEFDPD